MKYKQIPRKYAVKMFFGGCLLLVVGVALSLYSVPGNPQGNPPITLPTFPILEMSWSPIPLLLVLSAILMAGGWISWRHSVGPVMLIAVGLFLAGVVSEAVGFLYAITFAVGGATIYILPYGTQALLLIVSGTELGFLSIIFFWADYRQQTLRNLRM